MEGDKLKTSPKDYPADLPKIELLRYKSFLAIHRVSDEQVLADNFLQHSTNVFEALYPFDQLLNKSVEN